MIRRNASLSVSGAIEVCTRWTVALREAGTAKITQSTGRPYPCVQPLKKDQPGIGWRHAADQGRPDWRSLDEKGLYPAPPHDETGHTWHHDDGMLTDYITRGGQAVLDDRGVAFTSGMPGFGTVLEEDEIEAILDYIKSTSPEPAQRAQAERTRAVSGD
jgi:hypothetical protein